MSRRGRTTCDAHRSADGFLMLGTHAVAGAPAAAGGKDRATEQPWVPIAAAARTLSDAAPASSSAQRRGPTRRCR